MSTSVTHTHVIKVIALVVALLGNLSLSRPSNAQTTCDFNQGVEWLWNEANNIPPDFFPYAEGQWVAIQHPYAPMLNAWHPANWPGYYLTVQNEMIGLHISSPDGLAAYQHLMINVAPGTQPHNVLNRHITELLGYYLGQSVDWHVVCQQDSAQTIIPLIGTLVAVTNGETIVVAYASVYTEYDLPFGTSFFLAAAGPVEQFTMLTRQVFMPFLYSSKVGKLPVCYEIGVDTDGDGADDNCDLAPTDPNR